MHPCNVGEAPGLCSAVGALIRAVEREGAARRAFNIGGGADRQVRWEDARVMVRDALTLARVTLGRIDGMDHAGIESGPTTY